MPDNPSLSEALASVGLEQLNSMIQQTENLLTVLMAVRVHLITSNIEAPPKQEKKQSRVSSSTEGKRVNVKELRIGRLLKALRKYGPMGRSELLRKLELAQHHLPIFYDERFQLSETGSHVWIAGEPWPNKPNLSHPDILPSPSYRFRNIGLGIVQPGEPDPPPMTEPKPKHLPADKEAACIMVLRDAGPCDLDQLSNFTKIPKVVLFQLLKDSIEIHRSSDGLYQLATQEVEDESRDRTKIG